MADRDLHELLEGATTDIITEHPWRTGMRWRPNTTPTAAQRIAAGVREFVEPPRIEIRLNPEFVAACRNLNAAFGQAYVRASAALVQEFARMLNQKERR